MHDDFDAETDHWCHTKYLRACVCWQSLNELSAEVNVPKLAHTYSHSFADAQF